MTKTNVQLGQLNSAVTKQLGSFVDLPKIDVPFTNIVKRAQVTDLSNDLIPRMGIERVMVQSAQEALNEVGPSGERVFKDKNDLHDRFRVYGNISNVQDTGGAQLVALNTAVGIEFVFYGTGLNILESPYSGAGWSSYTIYVDGSLNTTLTNPATSNILGGRNYAMNRVHSIVSGLSLGLHTVRLETSQIVMYGFEILNEASTVKTNPGSAYVGGKKLSLLSQSSLAYNAVDTGSLHSTKGGRVVKYIDSSGAIKRAGTPVDTYNELTAASHVNEEVIRIHHWREFGANRFSANDDFSLLVAPASNKAFTLDDGTTSLTGVNVTLGTEESLNLSGGGNFYSITFVGTGLDIVARESAGAPTASGGRVTIDGTILGTQIAITAATVGKFSTYKIVSGLPYGTHTVKVERTVETITAKQFIVYGPKKPTVPTGSVELADYYVVGNYTITSSAIPGFTSNGVLRKLGTREMNHTGTWAAITLDAATFNSGFNIQTTTTAAYIEYTFYGTGVEWHSYVNNGLTNNQTILVDGIALNTGSNTGSVVTMTIGATTVSTGVAQNGLTTSAAGVITGTANINQNAFWRISGLTLGKHAIRITQNSTGAGAVYSDCFDVITPIHSPKSNLPGDLQNTLMIGSNGIGDSRVFAETQDLDIPNWTKAVAITSNPSTTSTTFVPMPDMQCTVKTNGNPIEISFSTNVSNSTVNSGTDTQIYIDGVADATSRRLFTSATVNATGVLANKIIVPVAAGVHTIQVYWAASVSGTSTAGGDRRELNVREM